MRPGRDFGRRLPPLKALRVFEAAARHLSFTRAAEELHVTQAAVSHQVKALEDYLGMPLFRRRNRALRLTAPGQDYLPAVRRAFEVLRDATERLLQSRGRETLTVSVLPSFAARWLVPRLGRFVHANPDIDLRVAPSEQLADFERDGVDVGIRYGLGRYPGLRADRLLSEDIFPVCSPALQRGDKPLQRPADLCHHVLLHDDDHGDWRTWLLAAGVDTVDPGRGPVFTDSSMLIQAAIAGQGIALARGVLVRDELAAGRLVQPFTLSLPTDYAYYIVCPAAAAERPALARFRQWLLGEAQAAAAPSAEAGIRQSLAE